VSDVVIDVVGTRGVDTSRAGNAGNIVGGASVGNVVVVEIGVRIRDRYFEVLHFVLYYCQNTELNFQYCKLGLFTAILRY